MAVIREFSAEERADLQPGPDTRVQIADNGIFNDVGDTVKNALQNGTAGTGPQYVIDYRRQTAHPPNR